MFSYINLYGKLLTTFLADELIQEFQSRDEEEQQEVLKKREELGKQVEFWFRLAPKPMYNLEVPGFQGKVVNLFLIVKEGHGTISSRQRASYCC